ncbi:MAG: hypothetical protein ACLSHN_10745 [Eubacterium sp.]|uniref:hypothetical protein n=1 Tax=Eubacterium sp. TaxID=142586 RepID=UPI00399220FD
MQYINIVIGFSIGANQSGGMVMSAPKNVFPITVTASPKYPPKSIPQTNVEIPQFLNIRSVFCISFDILGNFFNAHRHPKNINAPYAASLNIIPKKK